MQFAEGGVPAAFDEDMRRRLRFEAEAQLRMMPEGGLAAVLLPSGCASDESEYFCQFEGVERSSGFPALPVRVQIRKRGEQAGILKRLRKVAHEQGAVLGLSQHRIRAVEYNE